MKKVIVANRKARKLAERRRSLLSLPIVERGRCEDRTMFLEETLNYIERTMSGRELPHPNERLYDHYYWQDCSCGFSSRIYRVGRNEWVISDTPFPDNKLSQNPQRSYFSSSAV